MFNLVKRKSGKFVLDTQLSVEQLIDHTGVTSFIEMTEEQAEELHAKLTYELLDSSFKKSEESWKQQ